MHVAFSQPSTVFNALTKLPGGTYGTNTKSWSFKLKTLTVSTTVILSLSQYFTDVKGCSSDKNCLLFLLPRFQAEPKNRQTSLSARTKAGEKTKHKCRN